MNASIIIRHLRFSFHQNPNRQLYTSFLSRCHSFYIFLCIIQSSNDERKKKCYKKQPHLVNQQETKISDLEHHGEISLKVAFVIFDPVFRKFRKLKSAHQENKNLISVKLKYFHNFNHSLYYETILVALEDYDAIK